MYYLPSAGMAYHYTHSALVWAAGKIERTLSMIDMDVLPPDMRKTYDWLQAKVPEYKKLAEEYAEEAYFQDGAINFDAALKAVKKTSDIVHGDILYSILALKNLEKAIENLKG